MKHLLYIFLYFQSLSALSQKLILVNSVCNNVPITNLYMGVRNEVSFYEVGKNRKCINIQIKNDSTLDIQKKGKTVFIITPKSPEKSKLILVRLNGTSEYDSLYIDCSYYPLKFNLTPNPSNHRNFKNYDIKGLNIMDTRYRCDSLINNFKILKYTIELMRENIVVKKISINSLSDNKSLEVLRRVLQPGDSLYAKNILIKSRLGFSYTIDSYLLHVIQ